MDNVGLAVIITVDGHRVAEDGLTSVGDPRVAEDGLTSVDDT